MPFDTLDAFNGSGLTGGENAILARRPYIATNGRHAGRPVITVNTGTLDASGNPVYTERPINTNATLRKDEWVDLEDQIIEAARERLVIVDDFHAAGLTYNVGGLGTLVSEWETGSEITDAQITMDGETETEKDRQEFGLAGVPIPIIGKRFSIGERMLLASRQRGASLDVTTGAEAARAVARASEKMVFFGARVAAADSAGNRFNIPGLTTMDGRVTFKLSDWLDTEKVTPQMIFREILQMVALMEAKQRSLGPFTLYIPGAYASRFREDFKEHGDKTLMERVLDEDVIRAVRISDVLTKGNVLLLDMQRRYMDLGVAADVTTVQWQSGSGFTNHFMTYAAWAPRLKADFDGRCGICHGAVGG
ncbi:major capsid protein [Rhodovulum sulfidophilum]|uniref:major capsid protein n=1 Tax=Rhodovulum sulfidophilum TaxID=35806 RepID=UPI001F306FC7|nr:family 1 encapsulin nanocompartment shell protein [Rhodovulum sulfidophilum]MCE8440038.1 bacteriocin family protein [Rhodovulum sulfidophilum]